MSFKKMKIPYSLIILTSGIVLGILIQRAFSVDNLHESIAKFSDVLTYTEKYYVEDVDSQKLVEAAINGMLSKLDPHSVYIPAKEFENVEESFRGDFDGIGIEFQIINDTITVVSAISGGPSEALGIQPADRIVKINGENAVGISNEEVRNKLRGEAGTEVSVDVNRYEVKDLIHYNIKRDRIPLYSVSTHFMVNSNTGYVSVSRFAENTYKEVKDALDDLKSKGMTQLILDLRGNPGGYLQQAVKIADLFISGEKKIVYTKGRMSEFDEVEYSSKASPYENIPLIILVNNGSASASEILSGAVQDWDRGLIVGETTFGKALVQKQFVLSDDSALRLTIARYYTPSGRLIQRDYKNVKNKEEYYAEAGGKSENDGNNIEHTAEKDSNNAVFKTHLGRPVYSGGGITPDYIIKSEKMTDYTTSLLKNNILYQFVLNYIEKNKNRIKSLYGNNLKKFSKEFEFSENEIKSFINFAANKDVKFDEKDFNSDKEYILDRLKAQVARNYWNNKGWYSVILNSDNQFKKAVTLFSEAKALADLK